MPTDRPPAPNSPLTVLVADDNRDAADTLAQLLTLLGHSVRVAYGGAEAVHMAVADPPDCAILDIGMPGVDGYSVARQIRAEPTTRGIKLVAHTAYGDGEYAAAVRDAGFDHHFVKGRAGPSDIQGVLAMIREIKDLAETTREIARQSADLTTETKGLLQEAKAEFGETKDAIRAVKEELKEVKEELKEVKEELRDIRPDAPGSA